MNILGIETSCDETAAAIARGEKENVKILSNVVASQIDIHKKYGGVVPEVAAREHVHQILPVIDEALKKADMSVSSDGGLDAIAVTVGPGLITSLMVGIETAKTLAYSWNLPLIAVNHIEGHIYANFIDKRSIKYPALILTVSGGHTMLVLMRGHGQYETIGETRDDAAGEAFDKAAKLMNIGYPGGPAIFHNSQLIMCNSEINKIKLPRPMIDSPNFDFSFSGLKTAIKYELEKDAQWEKRIPEYCHEFQQAVIDVLIHKTIKAAKKYNVKTVMLAGGVAANTELRKQLKEATEKQVPSSKFQVPSLEYTTDNAAMIATAGYFNAKRKNFTPWQKLKVDCNFKL